MPQDTVENTLNRLHIQLGKDDVMGWELSDMITDDQTIVITKIEYKEETREEIIPYKTEKIDADDMLIGESQIVQQGQNGLKSCTYKTSYFNGNQWHSFKKTETIITPAVIEVIKVGTQNILEMQNVDLQNEDSVLLKTKNDDENFKLLRFELYRSGVGSAGDQVRYRLRSLYVYGRSDYRYGLCRQYRYREVAKCG